MHWWYVKDNAAAASIDFEFQIPKTKKDNQVFMINPAY